MQKKFGILGILLSVLMLASCASVPKKVKPGTGLVIGRTTFTVQNCAPYEGQKLNGSYKNGVKLTLVDWDTQAQKEILADDEGYFYLPKLNPDHQYTFTRAEVAIKLNNGVYSFWVQMGNPKFFSPVEGEVLNLGYLFVTLNCQNNMADWDYSSHYLVKENFLEIAEDSEWATMPIEDLR